MYDIITIGGATLDVFMNSRRFLKKKGDLCFKYGAKIIADKVFFGGGGGAANTAVSFASLGFKVDCFTKVGKDEMGDKIIDFLKNKDVNTSLVAVSKKHESAMSVSLQDIYKERTLILYRGASDKISKVDFKIHKFKKTKWIYLAHLSGRSDCISSDVKFFMKRNEDKKLAWNPGSTQLKKGIRSLSPLMKNTEIFFVNKQEAIALTKSRKSISDATSNFIVLGRKLLSHGPKVVVISNGKKGAYAFNNNEHVFMPATSDKPIDATGAGDAFCSGFTAGYIENDEDIEEAMKWGIAQGGAVVRELGAQNGLYNKTQLKRKIKTMKKG